AQCDAVRPAGDQEQESFASSVIEYGARYGDLVCVAVPALPTRSVTAVEVDSVAKVVSLPLWSPQDERPELVALTLEEADEAWDRCRDESLPAPQRARDCAHLAFLLEQRDLESMTARPQSLPRRAWRELRRREVTGLPPRELWAMACEQGDARACEAAGERWRTCVAEDPRCPMADQWFAAACEAGRSTACLRQVAPFGASWPGIDQLYRLVDDHPLRAKISTTPRRWSKDYRRTWLRYPAVQLGFDPRGWSRSYQLQASWLNLFARESRRWIGVWAKLATPTLVSFEQRVIEGDTVRIRRVYGGQLSVEGVGRLYAELLKERETELLLFASAGLGYGIGWVDGFRVSGDALAGVGFSVNGWGLDAGVRTLRAPYTRTQLEGTALRSNGPRLGVYVSLETNFDFRGGPRQRR
ncbi:MAG: hypothetical protein AB1Z98_24415, partial [Nannocystaceae bacterium]